VIVIAAGALVQFDPAIKSIVEAADLSGWKVAALVLGAIVLVRLLLAPYWIYEAQRTKLNTAALTLSRISEDRPFTYVTMTFEVTGQNFHAQPIYTVNRMEFLFENISDRILKYEIRELYFEFDGKRTDIPISNVTPNYIHARQQMGYGFDVSGLVVQTFPTTFVVGFDIEYDNEPSIRRRGTKRVIRNTFKSFKPMVWNDVVTDQREYWPEDERA